MRKNTFDFNMYGAWCTADFETSTEKWKVDKAYVWLWDICGLNGQEGFWHKTGTDIESFMDIVLNNGRLFCFHNLAYDGLYILNYLFEHGYKCVEKEREQLKDKEFTTVISGLGQHYEYHVKAKHGVTTFMDTLKYYPMSVEKIAEEFHLPIKKGKIDYDKYREIGEYTQEEINYIRNDTEIVARALSIGLSEGDHFFTSSSNARYHFKKSLGKEYKAVFPQLSIEEDEYIRRAYTGGFTYLNPEKECIDIGTATSWDCNSMYPDKMLHELMPYGLPEWNKGKAESTKDYPLFIQRFRCSFTLKEGKTPMIPVKKFLRTANPEYMTTSHLQILTMTLCNVDLDLFFDNYNVYNLEWIDYCSFRAQKGHRVTPEEASKMTVDEVIEQDGKGSFFYDYFKPWRMIKEHSKGAKRFRAKRKQNELYGTFATNPKRISQQPYFEDGIVKFRRTEPKIVKTNYIPVAVFVTAYSRKQLITIINNNKKSFIYSDTDSYYGEGMEPPKGIDVHPSLYGFFKNEHIIQKARFIGAKRYIYYGKEPPDGEYKWIVRCCGAPKEVVKQMSWENFLPDSQFNGKIVQKTVKGGKHLCETTYLLKMSK